MSDRRKKKFRKRNDNPKSLLYNLIQKLKEQIQNSGQKLQKFAKEMKHKLKHPSMLGKKLLEVSQLTLIYFFPLLTLIFTIQQSLLDDFPDLLYGIIPYADTLFTSRWLQFLADPSQLFLIYFFLFELILGTNFFKVSVLVKFNLMLSFVLEMLQNLAFLYWDLINAFQDSLGAFTLGNDLKLMVLFYSLVFLFWYFLYIYCYILAINGRFPRFGNSKIMEIPQKIIDSVAFWVKLKRPKQ